MVNCHACERMSQLFSFLFQGLVSFSFFLQFQLQILITVLLIQFLLEIGSICCPHSLRHVQSSHLTSPPFLLGSFTYLTHIYFGIFSRGSNIKWAGDYEGGQLKFETRSERKDEMRQGKEKG